MLEDLKLDDRYDGFLFLAEAARNPPVLRAHHHVELELNLVIRGEITYVTGGQRFTFPARTLLWMFPAQEHQLVNRTTDAANFVAVFKPELIARSCRSDAYAGLRRKTPGNSGVLHTLLDPESFDLVRLTMESLMPGSLDADLLNREAGFGLTSTFSFQHADPDGLNAGLHHLLLLGWRSQRHGRLLAPPVALHPAVCRAIKQLSDADWEGDLASLAAACGVSESYLSRTFHQQVGVPLNRYRNTLRLSRFWEHFRGPRQRTLSEAVFEAGFGSYAQFYRVFRQAYGSGPRKGLETVIPRPNGND